MIEVELHRKIGVFRVAHGKANALDTELCEAITVRLEEHRHSSMQALVFIGQDRSFPRAWTSPQEASATAAQEDRALIEVLAQGHRWLEQWRRGEIASLRAIAKSAGKSERHVSQVIRAAFLTPELVEAVLHGRQPAQLTLRQVMKQLPWDWSEQRRRFGLAPRSNDSLSVHDSPWSIPL